MTECPWCARPRAIPDQPEGRQSCPSIFISGGAAGIGLATAERFAREGWTVGVYDYDDKALAAVKKDHPEFITGHLDVRKADEWTKALADFTSHTDGKLDVLDNNAGILVAGRLMRSQPEAVASQIDIDVTGVTLARRRRSPSRGDARCTPSKHLLGLGDLRSA